MKTILVVEDEQFLRELITFKLEKDGYKVLPAYDAECALQILEKEKPDLIWLDLLLPEMNGLEFAEKLKSEEKTKNIPIVMVSVSGGPETVEKAFAVGVSDYIVKSQFTLDRIIQKIKLFIK